VSDKEKKVFTACSRRENAGPEEFLKKKVPHEAAALISGGTTAMLCGPTLVCLQHEQKKKKTLLNTLNCKLKKLEIESTRANNVEHRLVNQVLWIAAMMSQATVGNSWSE
jgi:hypothetical protein